MKTTLIIDDTVLARVKREAAERRSSMSALVEAALRRYFAAPKPPKKLPPLPTFDGGGYLVDIADRNALYDAMERE